MEQEIRKQFREQVDDTITYLSERDGGQEHRLDGDEVATSDATGIAILENVETGNRELWFFYLLDNGWYRFGIPEELVVGIYSATHTILECRAQIELHREV